MTQKKLFELLLLWLPVIVWASVVFSFSASSFPASPVTAIHWNDFILKKLAHIIEYAILAILMYRALKESGMEKKNAGYSAIILCFLYGLSDEFHQSFTPGREPTLRDVIIDTIGGSAGIWITWKLLPKVPEKPRKWLENLRIM
jgi:VanZ family protein